MLHECCVVLFWHLVRRIRWCHSFSDLIRRNVTVGLNNVKFQNKKKTFKNMPILSSFVSWFQGCLFWRMTKRSAQNFVSKSDVIRGVATEISAPEPATGSDAHEEACTKSEIVSTIGLMVKSYEIWGRRTGCLGTSGARLPRHPRWHPWMPSTLPGTWTLPGRFFVSSGRYKVKKKLLWNFTFYFCDTPLYHIIRF